MESDGKNNHPSYKDGFLMGRTKKIPNIWVFPTIVVPQNGWFIRENPIEMDDLGGNPLFLETPIWFDGSDIPAKAVEIHPRSLTARP